MSEAEVGIFVRPEIRDIYGSYATSVRVSRESMRMLDFSERAIILVVHSALQVGINLAIKKAAAAATAPVTMVSTPAFNEFGCRNTLLFRIPKMKRATSVNKILYFSAVTASPMIKYCRNTILLVSSHQ
mmetsp:Transcript_13212/g.19069  ORF Transcript_13212/g.19069 Transcript_13212/m.19069 type:complete len:129 (-) Transcript_13212:720-1106(-)